MGCGFGSAARAAEGCLSPVSTVTEDLSRAVSFATERSEDLSPDLGSIHSGSTVPPFTTGDYQRFVDRCDDICRRLGHI